MYGIFSAAHLKGICFNLYIYIFAHLCVLLPVSGWGDEVYAAVDSGVWNPFLSVYVDFLLQVRFILVVNKLHDGLPAK